MSGSVGCPTPLGNANGLGPPAAAAAATAAAAVPTAAAFTSPVVVTLQKSRGSPP